MSEFLEAIQKTTREAPRHHVDSFKTAIADGITVNAKLGVYSLRLFYSDLDRCQQPYWHQAAKEFCEETGVHMTCAKDMRQMKGADAIPDYRQPEWINFSWHPQAEVKPSYENDQSDGESE